MLRQPKKRRKALDACARLRNMNGVHIDMFVMPAKAVIFLTRRDGLTREAFRDWWLTGHRAMAEKLPGLVRHCFNLLPEDAPYDAVVEQWFESADAMNGAYATDIGRAVAADSGAHVKARIRILVEEFDFPIADPSRAGHV